MSERVTWEGCPTCGKPAAVGWAAPVGNEAGDGSAYPLEFDCPSRCQLTADELSRAFGKPEAP
jgi:hypothetical protein